MLLPVFALAMGSMSCSSAAFDVADPGPPIATEGGNDDGTHATDTGVDESGGDTGLDSRPGEIRDSAPGDAHADAPHDDTLGVDLGGDETGDVGADSGAPGADGAADGAHDGSACIPGVETVKCGALGGGVPCCAPLLCDVDDGSYCVTCFALDHLCDLAWGATGGCCAGSRCERSASSTEFRCTP